MSLRQRRKPIALPMMLGLLIACLSTGSLLADALPAGLEFGQEPQRSLETLEARCSSVRQVEVIPPSFPLARFQESHLICEDYNHQGLAFDVLALTHADSALSLVFCRGNVAQLRTLSDDEFQPYLHFDASFKDLVVLDLVSDQAWLMSRAAAHANLFLWPNPYVELEASPDYADRVDVSDLLRFGFHLETLQPGFAKHCTFKKLGSSPVWLLTEPKHQQQLDCFGYEFAGFPRKIEAVFGDGVLEQAWILTGKGEEDRLRKALEATYGKPVHADLTWEVFRGGQVILRKDKPEVLLLSKALAPLFRAHHVDGRSQDP